VFRDYSNHGSYKKLLAGSYDAARLAARENGQNGIADGDIRSITVDANTVAVLYDGPNFEETQHAIFIEGPASVSDVGRYGMDGKVSSIKLFAVDSPPTNLPEHTAWGPPKPPAQSYFDWYKQQWGGYWNDAQSQLNNTVGP
jgi:hypothetical protein